MGVNGAKKKLGRFEAGRFENCLTEWLGRLVVKTKAVKRNKDQPRAVLLEGDSAGRDWIVNPLRKLVPAGVTGQRHWLGWGDVDAGRSRAQPLRPRIRQQERKGKPEEQSAASQRSWYHRDIL